MTDEPKTTPEQEAAMQKLKEERERRKEELKKAVEDQKPSE